MEASQKKAGKIVVAKRLIRVTLITHIPYVFTYFYVQTTPTNLSRNIGKHEFYR